jgi:hypothetical protein
MTAKIIQTMTRPNLESMFLKELHTESILEEKPKIGNLQFAVPIAVLWYEEISFDEVYVRRNELRPDLELQINIIKKKLNSDNINGNQFENFTLLYNPFSLTDTRVYIFNSESDMRQSRRMVDHLPRYREDLYDIRRLENTITLQFFVDDKLVETVEFK